MRLPFLLSQITAEQSRELRRAVLRPHLPAGSQLPGDTATGAIHLAAYLDQTIVSACLILPEPCPWLAELRPDLVRTPTWRLRGMATDPEHRGTGAGAAVLGHAELYARGQGALAIWCLAREGAVRFYSGQGWQGHGEIFDTDIGPHLKMWHPLNT